MTYHPEADITPGRPWTRRMYLMVRAMERAPDSVHPIAKYALATEAVASTALEHPEWDLEEKRPWEQWEALP